MNDGDHQKYKLILRGLAHQDYPHIKRIMDRVYSDIGGAWKPDEYATLVNNFPEGQICIEDNGTVVAAALAILVDADEFDSRH